MCGQGSTTLLLPYASLMLRCELVLGDKANPQTTFHLNEGHVTDMCEIGGDLQSQRDVHYEVKVPAPSQRRGKLGRARRHTADAVRHF